jgi:hypothetical protein
MTTTNNYINICSRVFALFFNETTGEEERATGEDERREWATDEYRHGSACGNLLFSSLGLLARRNRELAKVNEANLDY